MGTLQGSGAPGGWWDNLVTEEKNSLLLSYRTLGGSSLPSRFVRFGTKFDPIKHGTPYKFMALKCIL